MPEKRRTACSRPSATQLPMARKCGTLNLGPSAPEADRPVPEATRGPERRLRYRRRELETASASNRLHMESRQLPYDYRNPANYGASAGERQGSREVDRWTDAASRIKQEYPAGVVNRSSTRAVAKILDVDLTRWSCKERPLGCLAKRANESGKHQM